MKIVGLVSGGKDSIYSLYKCVQYGHEIVCVANLAPENVDEVELDSWMFQTVGHQVIPAISECLQVPLVKGVLSGKSFQRDLSYCDTQKNELDEVEDLYRLLQSVINQFPEVKGVSCGAILSDYQRNRVENVCQRLGLVSLAYLWRRDQTDLLNEMIQNNFHVILIKTATMGLIPKKHCGKSLKELQPLFERLKVETYLNVCGEGGEYESICLDCPLYHKSIEIDEFEITSDDDPYAPVGHYVIKNFHLKNKDEIALKCTDQDFGSIFIKKPILLNDEVVEDVSINSNEHYIVASTSNSVNELFKKVKERTNQTIVQNVVTVKSIKEFDKINQIYNQYFELNDPPSRVFVENSEIDGIILESRISSQSIKTLHIQSISEWAPACIGPYSQARMENGIIRVSGQIGLNPPSMRMVSIDQEVDQCIKNIDAILKSFDSSVAKVFRSVIYYNSNKISKKVIKYLNGINILVASSCLPRDASVEYHCFAVGPKQSLEILDSQHVLVNEQHYTISTDQNQVLNHKNAQIIRIVAPFRKAQEIKKILEESIGSKVILSILPTLIDEILYEIEH